MPFDGPNTTAGDAVRVLTEVIEIFDHGEGWGQGVQHDGEGRYCAVGALRKARHLLCVKGEGAGRYLKLALVREGENRSIQRFNDDNSDYRNVENWVRAAIILAAADAKGMPRPRGPSGLFELPPAWEPPQPQPPSAVYRLVIELENCNDDTVRARMIAKLRDMIAQGVG